MAIERWEEYEDEELVVEALLGKAAAFDALVVRYRSAVLAAVVRRVSSRAVAEDICQEAFLRAFRALPKLQDPSRFAAWLHAIARREVIRHAPGEARAASYTPLDEQSLEHSGAMDASGWDSVERLEEGEWVRQALKALPEELQLVLILRYWSEMPLERIASFLGRPISTVKWRLYHARALMRQRLSGQPDGGNARQHPDGSHKLPSRTPSSARGRADAQEAGGGHHCLKESHRDTQHTWRNRNEPAAQWNEPRTAAHRAHAGQGSGAGP
jgi:RNA polymerase sigma-70 factor (ECF subfamily)